MYAYMPAKVFYGKQDPFADGTPILTVISDEMKYYCNSRIIKPEKAKFFISKVFNELAKETPACSRPKDDSLEPTASASSPA